MEVRHLQSLISPDRSMCALGLGRAPTKNCVDETWRCFQASDGKFGGDELAYRPFGVTAAVAHGECRLLR